MDAGYEKEMGLRIRGCRLDKDLTQDDLARMLQLYGCDINRSTLAKIESGTRHIYPDEIKAIKAVLRISYEQLFEDNQ